MNEQEKAYRSWMANYIITYAGIAVFVLVLACSALIPIVSNALYPPIKQNDAAEVIAITNRPVVRDDGETLGTLARDYSDTELIYYQPVAQSANEVRKSFANVHIPQTFELNVASHTMNTQAVVDAGGIVEWNPGYYVSHDYDEGAKFFNFQFGDTVCIDGMNVHIDGYEYFNYNYNTLYDVRGICGYDTVCFQTCTSDGLGGVIVYYGTVEGDEDAHFEII